MTKITKPKNSGVGDTLQQAVEDGLASIPVTLLEHQISKKLKEQIARPPKGLARKIAEHVLSGTKEPFVSEHAARRKNIKLTIDNADLEQLTQALERFQEKQLPVFISSMTDKTAKKTLKALKARWPDEEELQESDLAGFRARNVITTMLITLRDEIPKSFARVDAQIQREEKAMCSTTKAKPR